MLAATTALGAQGTLGGDQGQGQVHCGGAIDLSNAAGFISRPLYAESYLDSKGLREPEALAAVTFMAATCKANYTAPKPGQTLWLRFAVVNHQASARTWYIDFNEFIVDEVVLFDGGNPGSYSSVRAGRTVPKAERATQALKPKLPLVIPGHSQRTYLVKISGMTTSLATPFLTTEPLSRA